MTMVEEKKRKRKEARYLFFSLVRKLEMSGRERKRKKTLSLFFDRSRKKKKLFQRLPPVAPYYSCQSSIYLPREQLHTKMRVVVEQNDESGLAITTVSRGEDSRGT